MWVKRRDYDDMMKRALEANGTAQALERQLVSQKTTMDWLMVRLTQLEHERAQLLYRYMDVKITVPEIAPEPSRTSGVAAMSDLSSFTDMGDEEAKRLGIAWDNDGNVIQNGQRID